MRRVRVAVRLDDIAPTMRWDRFERMLSLLFSMGAKPLLGVIPDCRDEKLLNKRCATTVEAGEYAERLKALEGSGCVIAMHGLHHVYTTKLGGIFPLNEKSEFAGLPLEDQEKMLREGRELLSDIGIKTDIFMAPSHSYDKNTLRALVSAGFTKVTDGFGESPYRYMGLTFYPISISKDKSVQARHSGTTTFVYHVNSMEDEDFARAEALLKRAWLIPYKTLLYEPTVRRPGALMLAEGMLARAKRLAVESGGKGAPSAPSPSGALKKKGYASDRSEDD